MSERIYGPILPARDLLLLKKQGRGARLEAALSLNKSEVSDSASNIFETSLRQSTAGDRRLRKKVVSATTTVGAGMIAFALTSVMFLSPNRGNNVEPELKYDFTFDITCEQGIKNPDRQYPRVIIRNSNYRVPKQGAVLDWGSEAGGSDYLDPIRKPFLGEWEVDYSKAGIYYKDQDKVLTLTELGENRKPGRIVFRKIIPGKCPLP